MATAALIGGGLIVGGVANYLGKKEEAKATEAAAVAQQEQASPFLASAEQAQQTQMGLLGQGTPEQQAAALQSIQGSPLAQALNASNEETLQRRGIASGAGTGGILQALQQANQSNLLQGAFGGLQQVAGTGLGVMPGAQNALFQQGQAQGQAAAAPFNALSSTINQGAQIGAFAAGGGFGSAPAAAAPITSPAFSNFNVNPNQGGLL